MDVQNEKHCSVRTVNTTLRRRLIHLHRCLGCRWKRRSPRLPDSGRPKKPDWQCALVPAIEFISTGSSVVRTFFLYSYFALDRRTNCSTFIFIRHETFAEWRLYPSILMGVCVFFTGIATLKVFRKPLQKISHARPRIWRHVLNIHISWTPNRSHLWHCC